MTTEHNPVSWRYRKWRNGRRDSGLCIETVDGHDIAEMAVGSDVENARLIAAAPAMLEACKAALAALDSPEAQHVLAFTMEREALRAAIAAVEGKGGAE